MSNPAQQVERIMLSPSDAAEQLLAAKLVIRYARSTADAVRLHQMLGIDGAVLGGPWAVAARIHALADSIGERP